LRRQRPLKPVSRNVLAVGRHTPDWMLVACDSLSAITDYAGGGLCHRRVFPKAPNVPLGRSPKHPSVLRGCAHVADRRPGPATSCLIEYLSATTSRECRWSDNLVATVPKGQRLGRASVSDARPSACVSTYSRMFVTLPFRTVMEKTQWSSNVLFADLMLPVAHEILRIAV
jgi:hypothetical protein